MSGTTPPNADGSGQQPGNEPQSGAPQDGTPPQYGGPQYGGPQYGGPEHGGQQYGGPQYGSQEQPGGAPQDGAPQDGAQQYGAPQYGAPQQDPAPQQGGQPYGGQQYAAPAPNGAPQFAGAQYGAPFSPPRQSRGRRVLIAVLSVVVALAVAGLVRWGFSAAFGDSKQDMIAKSVAEIRKQSDLPKQVDSVTTWTAVTAEDDAIHYAYTVSSSVDPAAVTKSSVKGSIVPTLCSTDSTRKILDDDIAMRYTYTFDGSDRTMDLTVTKADC